MKTIALLIITAIILCGNTRGQASNKTAWEFDVNKITEANSTGDLHAVESSFYLDGTNKLMLPPGILGTGNEYTIEFELKCSNRKDIKLMIFSMDDSDFERGGFRKKVEKGFAFAFYNYGAGMLYFNNSQTEMSVNQGTVPIPWKGDNKYFKQTFVVKDGRIQYFRDGLILLVTDPVPSPDKGAILTFGQLRGKKGKVEKLKTPLEVRNLKIYDKAIFPTDYDKSVKTRMNYSGPEYSLMREKITDPAKKRILIVGDSITMGYRSQISNNYKDQAYVDYWMGGAWFGRSPYEGGTNSKPAIAWKGISSQGPYDVITFNPMTLHWWSYKHHGRCDETYLADFIQRNIDYIRNSMPNTKLIWARCTPVRSLNEDGTSTVNNPENERIVKFNKIADEVIEKNNIPSVDLYSVALQHLSEVKKNHKDPVHWHKECNDDFAKELIREIDKVIK